LHPRKWTDLILIVAENLLLDSLSFNRGRNKHIFNAGTSSKECFTTFRETFRTAHKHVGIISFNCVLGGFATQVQVNLIQYLCNNCTLFDILIFLALVARGINSKIFNLYLCRGLKPTYGIHRKFCTEHHLECLPGVYG